MMARTERPQFVGDAILVDEVGIEYGVHGDVRLRSTYQPIFARDLASLRPVAVEGLIAPYVKGALVPYASFIEGIVPEDALFIESMCRTLHLRNMRNIGVDGLTLFFNYDPRVNSDLDKALREIRVMVQRLGELELDPARLVCEVTETASLDHDVLLALVAEMRAHGIRIAMDDFGAGHSTQQRFEQLKPDIVKIDGEWFRTICRHRATVGLFSTIVAGLKDRGADVLIEGIEDATHLGIALDADADLFQGFHLARPQLVGTEFSTEPLSLSDKLGETRRVVPLASYLTHQRR
jgi:EAL domain-containing protein (putative c-di-GMP-specific phosphodiesterase class I)